MRYGATRMTWLKPKEPEHETEQVGFRCPSVLKRYVRDTAKMFGLKDTEVWVFITRFYRDLGERLSRVQSRINAYAEAEGLKMPEDAHEAIARLVEKGLEEVERSHRKR